MNSHKIQLPSQRQENPLGGFDTDLFVSLQQRDKKLRRIHQRNAVTLEFRNGAALYLDTLNPQPKKRIEDAARLFRDRFIEEGMDKRKFAGTLRVFLNSQGVDKENFEFNSRLFFWVDGMIAPGFQRGACRTTDGRILRPVDGRLTKP